MNKIRNVHLIEFLYDLIYVYVLTRLTTSLTARQSTLVTIMICLLLSYLLLQSWFLLNSLVNQHGTWLWYEYVLLGLYLILMIYMSLSFHTVGQPMLRRFSFAMMLMMLIVAFLYLLLSYQMRSRAMLIHTLGPLVLSGIYLLGLLLSLLKGPAFVALFAAAAAGTLIPVFYQRRRALNLRFAQFAQEAELLMICLLASGLYYGVLFIISGNYVWMPIVLLTLILFAGCYILQDDTMLDFRQRYVPLRYVYSHYVMMLSLLGYFMSLHLLYTGLISTTMLKIMVAVSLGVLMIALIITAPYYMKPYHMTRFVAQRMLAGYAFGILVIFMSPILLFVLLGTLWIPASFFYLLLEIYDADET